jgi:hypothetical protein
VVKKAMFLIAIVLPHLVSAQSPALQTVEGLYLSYRGAEYEDTFMPCSSSGIWYVEDGGALQLLRSKYHSMSKSQYGEIFIVAKGRFTAVDRKQYPHAHYVGHFVISRLVRASSDGMEIAKCRKRQTPNSH